MSEDKQRLQAWGNSKVISIVSCLLLSPGSEILLLKRHADDLGGGLWSTPGGRIDGDETPVQAITRELYEETGLQLEGFELLGGHEVSMPHGTVRMLSFLCRIERNIPITLDPVEHQGQAWFSLDELLGADNIIWGLPTVLYDFGLLPKFKNDPTLRGEATIRLLQRTKN